MENNNEIINNNTSNDTEPIKKVRKPKTEAQKEAQKRYYLKSNQAPIIWNAQEYQAKNIMTVTRRRF